MNEKKRYFKINFLITSISFFLCTFLTISYAALTTNLNIQGEVVMKSPENIRLANIQMTNSTNGALENYNPLVYLEEFVTSVNMPNLTSTATYTVTLKNSSTKNYKITNISPITFSNSDMEYVIEGLAVGDIIDSGTVSRTFTITYRYKSDVTVLPANIDLNAMIGLSWQEAYFAIYNSFGGSSCASKRVANTFEYGTLCVPTRANYRFAGWFTQEKGNGQNIVSSTIVSLTSDITLIARWIYEQDVLVGNFPRLTSGMIPVVYNEVSREWLKADLHEAWYDYNVAQWPNIVTVRATNRNTLLNAPAGTIIPMSDINTMFVWIPRYSYSIRTTFGEGGTSASNPGHIMIKFIDRTVEELGDAFYASTPLAGDWRTHPAFWWDQNNDDIKQTTEFLNGIWVSKFEVSPSSACTAGTTVNAGCDILTIDPFILPNALAWRGVRLSTAWTVVNTNMNGATGNTKYGFPNATGFNAHMMKNTQWGAIAYLTQSLYGKYGNPNFATVPLKEVYINNSSSYFTGRSGGRPGYTSGYTVAQGCFEYHGLIRTNNVACNPTGNFSGTAGQFLTGANLFLAYGASSTGNITGVYDMSGGSNEFMMTNYYGPTSPFNHSGANSTTNTGFNGIFGGGGSLTTGRAWPEFRFYDRYTTTTLSTSCGGSICFGHAFSSEMASWWGDTNTTALTTSLVSYIRGGVFSGAGASGIFRSANSSGNQTTAIGFRVALTILAE